MSFSSQLKKDITSGTYKNTGCKKALLQGMVTARGRLVDGLVAISVENSEYAQFICDLVLDIFSKTATVLPPPKGGSCKLVCFESKAVKSYIEQLSENRLEISYKCALCHSSFLRGIYFVCGRASDPNKQFCLEFSIGNREFIRDFFEEIGIELKHTQRKSESVLYTKNSSVMEDFFAMADLNRAAFDIMNLKINNDFYAQIAKKR